MAGTVDRQRAGIRSVDFPVVLGSFKRPTSRKLHYRLRRVAAGVFALPGECSETVHPGTANPA
jgi:hypothetical protein